MAIEAAGVETLAHEDDEVREGHGPAGVALRHLLGLPGPETDII
jgi:hypothetical protein